MPARYLNVPPAALPLSGTERSAAGEIQQASSGIGQALSSIKSDIERTVNRVLEPINAALNEPQEDVRSAIGTCPFAGLEIGIVPVRYAIDEIADDSGETLLGKHPLPENGLWQPPLQLDAPYTLRQLRDGWLYVYSEQGKTFHEYQVQGTQFIKYDWSEADFGQDERGQPGASNSCLTYPAHHVLYMAFSHQRWSWRVCEHMRSNMNSRNSRMRRVPLPKARRCDALTHMAQTDQLGTLVADINAATDTQFAFSCTPFNAAEQKDSDISSVAAKPAADAPDYTQGLPDAKSGLLVALDDPLADVCDLYLQLAPEWISLQELQQEHKLQMINTTEQMALPFIDEGSLPEHLHNNTTERLRFKQQVMEHVANWQAYREHHGSDHTEMVMRQQKAERLQQTGQVLIDQGFEPDDAQLSEWTGLQRYQDDIDWPALYGYLAQFEQRLQRAQHQLVRCHRDLRQGCEQLGANPLWLGLDNHQEAGQKYLHSLFHDILPMLTLTSVNEPLKNELTALLTSSDPHTLLALAPYGFDRDLYDAVTRETVDNPLFNLDNSSDTTALAGRLGDWNTIKGDSQLRDSVWYRGLVPRVQGVLEALSGYIATGAAQVRNQMLSAIFPQVWTGGPVAGLRLMLMDALVEPGLQFEANPRFASEMQNFENQHKLITKDIHNNNRPHNQQSTSRHQRSTAARLNQQLDDLYATSVPRLIKFKAEHLNSHGRNAVADYLSRAGEAVRRGSSATLQGLNNTMPNLGTVGGGVALVNLWNLQQVLANVTENAKKNGNWYAAREVGFTVSWTGNAIAALYQGNVWSDLAKNHGHLLKRSLKDAASMNGAVIRSFVKTMGFMSGLGLVAAGLEAFHTFQIANDPNSIVSDVERRLYWAKAITLSGQFIIFSAQIFNLLTNAALGAVFAPWMIAGMFVLGVLYLGISLLLNHYQQTGLEKWLRQSSWGVQCKNWSEQEELFKLEQQIYQPGGQVTEKNGYQLELAFPKYLHQQSIGLEVVLTPEQPIGPGPQRTINCNIQQGDVFDEGNYLRYQLALPAMGSKWFSTLVRVTYAANQGQQQHAFTLSGRGLDALSTKVKESLSVNTNLILETETV
ncbi:T6SS effector BTH_I2691 family protein [Oceanimonas sp. CHS3-5]|uniref:T6SS effector BTH_I2691 family protein n=1 Tax=Oceanimonas sp. CHS3-5 TaxID=3068186 RepID=UPI00273DE193|nr:T6SS effector BTH_I2691 family protein [Oceanimonas sp. CHS3-5]MDP5291717.1 T6SS effector BTH_I2691 family protein [Oceanimonas sp. CHS3-5]